MIRLVTIPSVFTASGREIREVADAATVGDLLDREQPAFPSGDDGTWHTIVHGTPVDRDHELTPGDEVVAIRKPKAFFIPFIIFALVNAVIGIGISLLISLLMGAKKQANRGRGPEGSETYNWTGIQNTYTNGNPIPIVYGEHRLGGQILGLFRRNVDAASLDMDLYMLICMGFGPITAIGEHTEDLDDLITSGSTEDNGRRLVPNENIEIDSRWISIFAGGGLLQAFNASNDEFLSTAIIGERGYEMLNTAGFIATNCSITVKAITRSAAGPRFCIAMTNTASYFGFYWADSTLTVIKRKIGVDSTLFTFSIADDDIIRLERFGNCIKAFKNGIFQDSADADPDLDVHKAGIHMPVTANVDIFTDIEVGAAKGLPDGTLINGVDANTYNSIRGHIRMGNYRQDAISDPNFTKVIQAYQPAITMRTNWTNYKFHRPVEGYHIILDFIGGLFDQTAMTGLDPSTVTVEVEFSENGDPFAPITGSPFVITETTTQAFAKTIFQDTVVLTGTDQKLRIRRQKRSGGETDTLISDKCIFADVNEIQRDDRQTYDGFVLFALRIRATDQLQGGTPVVTTLIKGVQVPHWDGEDEAEPALVYQYSDNPSDVAMDILLSKQRGLGNFITVQDIDVAAFKEWREECDEVLTYTDFLDEPLASVDDTLEINAGSTKVILTAGGNAFPAQTYCRIAFEGVNIVINNVENGDGTTTLTLFKPALTSYPAGWVLHKIQVLGGCNLDERIVEKRHSFNGVFDGSISAWDALLRVARVGRAMPVKLGNRIGVRIEREGVPVQHINEAAMVKGSMEITYIGSSERVDILEAQYLDASDDYDQAVALAGGFPPPSIAKEPIHQSLNLYGIVTASEARREANYHLLAQRLLQKRLQFQMALDGIAAEQGDIISVSSVLANWAHWTGRVTGIPSKFVVSHEVILTAGVTYVAMIKEAGVRAPAQVTITASAGTYAPGDEITTDATSLTQLKDALCTIGIATNIDREYRIVGMVLKSDLTVEIECVEYNEEIYGLQVPPLCFCELPPPGGNINEDCTYFIPLPDVLCPCNTGCVQTVDCRCCCEVTISVEVIGGAAGCVTIIEIGDDGFIFRLDPSCTGSICFEITIGIVCNYVCVADCSCEQVTMGIPPCNQFWTQFTCSEQCTVCYEIV